MSSGIAAAGLAAGALVGCCFAVEAPAGDSSSATSDSTTPAQSEPGSANGGTYATALVGQTDFADYGPYRYYGLMGFGDEYPASASVLNARAYVAPEQPRLTVLA